MKIHKIWAENVRGIRSKIEIEPALSGATLFHAPNESGKTTLSEVVTFLFNFPASSNSQVIQALVPVGRDVGPTMGAIIEVNGDRYEIEKRWVKDRKTEVNISGSRKLQLCGSNAEKAITELFKNNLNESFWELLQLGQAEFTSIIDREFEDEFVADLQNLLDSISSTEESAEADSLFGKVESEYLKWFTSSGRPVTAANTQGRKIKELEDELVDHQRIKRDLEEKINDSERVAIQFDEGKVNRAELQRTHDAQQLHKKLTELEHSLSSKKAIKDRIAEYLQTYPKIEAFSPEDYSSLRSLYPLSLKYSALSKIKVTALKNLELTINGNSTKLDTGEGLDIALESPLDIKVPGVMTFSFSAENPSNETSLEESFDQFNALLEKMGCSDYSEAEELSRVRDGWSRECKQLEISESGLKESDLLSEIEALTSDLDRISDWENLILQSPVHASALQEAVKTEGIQEGRWLQINQNGWDASINNEIVTIREIEKNLDRLNRQRQAAKLLYETLTEKREGSARDLAPVFAEKLNEVAALYYGEVVSFQVSEDFKIESRFKAGSTVRIANLSTGAKEQLAILIRITLSRLIQKNDSVPVFFDDEFGHSDQGKIDAIENVLRDFGEDQQFILMTCYPEKFKNVNFELKKSLF
jgi:uncharacterized protein YhaN